MKKVIATMNIPVDLVEDLSSKTNELYRCLEIKITNKTTERVFIPSGSLELLELRFVGNETKPTTNFKATSSSN